MQLALGLCYAVLLANGNVVQFRFTGQNANGQVIIEVPPGSGNIVPFYNTIGAYIAYWQIPCP
jgi:hypothetical protein